MKRELTEWKKYLQNHASDKGLISKIYKECILVNSKPTNNSNKKMGKGLEQTFP